MYKSSSKKSRYNRSLKCAMRELDQQLHALELCKLQHHLLVAREQLLVDTMLQLAQAASFRNDVESQITSNDTDGTDGTDGTNGIEGCQGSPDWRQHKQQQDSDQRFMQQQPASFMQGFAYDVVHYSTRLLQSMHVATVERVLGWQANDWHTYFSSTAAEISITLEMLGRIDGGSKVQKGRAPKAPNHMQVVEQRFAQIVDGLAGSGLVGAIFGDRVGQQLGLCTSTNHVTMQQEAPPADHWQHILQKLQPTYTQLLHFAVGFQEFKRQCKARQAMQLALTVDVACNNSCNLQVLAATKETNSSTSSGSPYAVRSGCPSPSSSSDEANDTDERTASAEPASTCSSTSSQLLRALNQSFIMLQTLMLNTLTRKQIATLVVSSFPYVPRPAPLMEAAQELLTTQHGSGPAGANRRLSSAEYDTALADIHMQQRIQSLQQQVHNWWRQEDPEQLQAGHGLEVM